MKTLRMVVLMSLVMMFASIAMAQVDAQLYGPGYASTPTIDGDLSDWPVDAGIVQYPVVVASGYSDPLAPSADFTMTWQAFYNPATNDLYLGVEWIDDVRIIIPSDWFTDRLEVYFDGNNNEFSGTGEYQQIVFDLDGTGGVFHSGVEVAELSELTADVEWVVADDGLDSTFEIRMPLWDVFPDTEMTLTEGMTFGFDITVPDRDAPPATPELYAGSSFMMWTTGGGKWGDPEMFGKVSLGVPVTPSPTATPSPAPVYIDGDFSDWAFIDPLDVTPNPTEGVESIAVVNDILDIYGANDDNNFYLRVVFTEAFHLWDPPNEAWALLGFEFDTDNDTATGFYDPDNAGWTASIGVDLSGERAITQAIVDGSGGGWSSFGTFDGATQTDNSFGGPNSGFSYAWSSTGDQIEISISRDDIVVVNGETIAFVLFTHAPNGTEQQDWSPGNSDEVAHLYTLAAWPPEPVVISAARGEWILYE